LAPQGTLSFRIAPMICFEDTLPAFGRRLAELHPHLLVTLASDSWFGATQAPTQHLALAVYRSVELRVPTLRAVNAGLSGLIRSTGETFLADGPSLSPMNAGSVEPLWIDVPLLAGEEPPMARMARYWPTHARCWFCYCSRCSRPRPTTASLPEGPREPSVHNTNLNICDTGH
jgi:hypothetical protein